MPTPGDPRERLRELEDENRQLKENLLLVEDLRSRLSFLSEKVSMINRLCQELNSIDLDAISAVAVRKIPHLVEARRCALYLHDYANDELILIAQSEGQRPPERIPLRARPCTIGAVTVREHRTLHIPDLDAFERDRGIKLDRTLMDRDVETPCLSLPLFVGRFLVGVLFLADKTGGAGFSEVDDIPALEQVGRFLGMALRNSRLFAEVKNQAETDGMTRLANYRAFHRRLQDEIHRAARYGRPLGLLMLDVDGFKKINDTFGHPAGDAVLTGLARVIERCIRQEDMAARYGGDEIAVILPETASLGVIAAAQRLLTAIRDHEFSHEKKRIPVEVSIGAVAYRSPQNLTEFVATADEALYRAKQAGKNCVETKIRP